MDMQPKLTVSGFRGIWGASLTDSIAREYARAFGALVVARGGKKVLVGRDGRASGREIMEAVIGELCGLGLDVLDLGMMPTPTVLFLIKTEGAGGAVIVTASHNPIEYNGLKFAVETGSFTTEADVAEIEALRGAATAAPHPSVPGARTDGSQLFAKHLARIAEHVDFAKIRAQKFSVAIDPINSVGCTTTPKLLDAVGAEVTGINSEPTGAFAHEPEPVAKNLTALSALVKEKNCDIGLAQDPDGDRLVLIDETGTILSEEYTLPLCLSAILSKTKGDVVINLSTSNTSEDVARALGAQVLRSKVGEANVVQKIRETGAVAGGEGSSGAIWPAINPTRDSFVCMALVLELMAASGKKLSELAAELPQYALVKDKFPRTGELGPMYVQLKSAFPEAIANEEDGLRLDFPDRSWIHLRPSNTEPIVRIFAEARTAESAAALSAKAQASLAG